MIPGRPSARPAAVGPPLHVVALGPGRRGPVTTPGPRATRTSVRRRSTDIRSTADRRRYKYVRVHPCHRDCHTGVSERAGSDHATDETFEWVDSSV